MAAVLGGPGVQLRRPRPGPGHVAHRRRGAGRIHGAGGTVALHRWRPVHVRLKRGQPAPGLPAAAPGNGICMPKNGTKGSTDIPSTLERSDKHAQEIWGATHDSAVESYGEG